MHVNCNVINIKILNHIHEKMDRDTFNNWKYKMEFCIRFKSNQTDDKAMRVCVSLGLQDSSYMCENLNLIWTGFLGAYL